MSKQYSIPRPIETKAVGDEWEVSGYLSVYGVIDDGQDMVIRGAFDDTLQSSRKVKFLFDHDSSKILGPPLELKSDDYGLFARGRISKTVLGAEVHTLLLDGALDSWSIGYVPTDVDWQKQEDGTMVRLLRQCDLLEGSLVAVPMLQQAVVTGVKAADEGEAKPYPTEHACRLRDPDDFQADSFRRVSREHDGKSYDVILGKLQGDDALTEQAYRYPVETWDADAARAHCRDHEGSLFEPAADGKAACDCAHESQDDTSQEQAAYATVGAPGRSWEDHATTVRAQCEVAESHLVGLITRARVRVDLRAKEGRRISQDTRAHLEQVLAAEDGLKAAFTVLRQLLADTAPPPKGYRIPQGDLAAIRLRVAGLMPESEAKSA